MNERNEREVLERLRPTHRITASTSFRERVMSAIHAESERASSRRAWQFQMWPQWVTVGVAATALLLLVPMLPLGNGKREGNGVRLLAQSVEAISRLQSVHIAGRIRTVAGDNFELIGLDYDFVPVEIWREYTSPPRWRVEKPGRVVTMDGQRSLLYIGKTNSAMYGPPGAGFVQWLRPMLDPQSILENELANARRGASQATVSEANGVITAVLRRSAQGNLENDWARNTSIQESDHATVYRFDARTKLLQGVQVVVSAYGGEVVVAEFDRFIYNEAIPDSLYTVPLPADVNWMRDRGNQPAPVTFAGPKEVAAYFFDALGREDWDTVLNVSQHSRVSEPVKQIYGRLQVISLGEPFQSGLYPGYFVPYEVRLRNGATKSFKLAVRNDNPQRRWLIDGGF